MLSFVDTHCVQISKEVNVCWYEPRTLSCCLVYSTLGGAKTFAGPENNMQGVTERITTQIQPTIDNHLLKALLHNLPNITNTVRWSVCSASPFILCHLSESCFQSELHRGLTVCLEAAPTSRILLYEVCWARVCSSVCRCSVVALWLFALSMI